MSSGTSKGARQMERHTISPPLPPDHQSSSIQAIKVTAKPKVVMFNQMNWQLMPPTGPNNSSLISPVKQFKINSSMPQFNCSTNAPVRKLTIKEVKTIPKSATTSPENSIPTRESTKTAEKIVTISKDNQETRTYSVSDTPSVPTLVEVRSSQKLKMRTPKVRILSSKLRSKLALSSSKAKSILVPRSAVTGHHSQDKGEHVHDEREDENVDDENVDDEEEEDDDDADIFHDFQEGNPKNDNEEVDQLNHDHIIRTIYLCCPLPDCHLTIPFNHANLHAANTNTKDLIDAHMRQVHGCSRMPSICLDCKRPYPAGQLDDHLAQHHSFTGRDFKCPKCHATFKTYHNLAGHNHLAHVLGCFECAMYQCTFTASSRIEVYRHKQEQHQCYFAGCGKTHQNRSRMKRHNLQHLGVNLYRCDWPDCTDFAGANTRAQVVKHIREKHTDGQTRAGVAVPHPNLFVKEITFIEAMQSAGKFDFEI